MKKQIILFSILGMLASTLGCSGGEGGGFEIPSISPPVTSVPVEVDPFVGSPLYINLKSRWEYTGNPTDENQPEFKTLGFANCAIPPLSTKGTVTNCSVSVPEAKLFFSELSFNIGTKTAASCPIIRFFPYYYRRSVQQNYIPPGETAAIDCRREDAGTPLPDLSACYGGIAPQILDTSFPEYKGKYFLTGEVNEVGYTVKASNQILYYGPSLVNYMVINDLPAADRLTSVLTGPNARAGDEGAGAVDWHDYQVTCESPWGEVLYTVNLTLSDENEDNDVTGPADEYPDWQ